MATKDEHRSRIDELVLLDLKAGTPVNQTCGILLDELAAALARIDELELMRERLAFAAANASTSENP